MASGARLFHTIVVVGASMTASGCGATVTIDAEDGDPTDAKGGSNGTAGAGGVGGAAGEAGAATTTSGKGGGGSGGAGGMDACTPTACDETAKVTECGDCLDNDADGAIDARDPECANACGSSESCPSASCPSDSASCGLPCHDPCPSGFYCITGCCVTIA